MFSSLNFKLTHLHSLIIADAALAAQKLAGSVIDLIHNASTLLIYIFTEEDTASKLADKLKYWEPTITALSKYDFVSYLIN